MRYLLTVYGDQSTWGSLSADDAKAELDAFAAFEREASEKGVLATNAALRSEAHTLSIRNGAPRVTEGGLTGPEGRMRCFYLLDCRDLAEATEWASKIPLVGAGGFHSIEIREVMGGGKMTELPPDVRTLFDGPHYAHVATLLPDGAPHSVPVWVGLEGERIVFLTDPASRKARNLDHDPRVAISITDRDQPFTMAEVRGRVSERLEDEAAFAVIDRISHKYTGSRSPLRTNRVVFLVEAEHAWGKAYA